MIKRISAFIFIIVILSLLIWMLFQTSKEEIMPIGSHLPEIVFSTLNGTEKLKQQSNPIIIVYFSTSCEHCSYELGIFNKHIKEFSETDIYFFTKEKNIFTDSLANSWQQLWNANNVKFGIVDIKSFKNLFGSTSIPYLFFFDYQGRLKTKIRGELRFEKIMIVIESLTSGQTQSSGIN